MGKDVDEKHQATVIAAEKSSRVPKMMAGYDPLHGKETLLNGKISSGRGKAFHHVKNSLTELEASTGIVLFPGSLNVVLDREVKLKVCNAIIFDNGRRYLWEANVEGFRIWIYRWKGTPFHIVELFSDKKLRDALGLMDGSKISIRVNETMIDHISMKGKLVSFLLWGGRRRLFYNGNYTDNHFLKTMRLRLSDGQR